MLDWISPTAASAMTEDRTPASLPRGFRIGVALATLTSSVADLGRAKLQPREPEDADQVSPVLWPVTAAAWRIVLAPAAPDIFVEPENLLRDYDRHRLEKERSLAVVTTIDFKNALTRHDCMRSACRLAELLADEMQASSLVVLHVPGDSGHDVDIHAHVLTLGRRHRPTGWGEPLTRLLGKKSPDLLYDRWTSVSGQSRT